jgi:hypothetical protein
MNRTAHRTLYQDPTVQVTSEVIVVDGRAYALADLARVWHRRGQRSWRAVAGRGALGLAMLVPVGLGLIGVLVALSMKASPAMTVAMVLGAVLIGFLAGPLADVLLEYLDRSYTRGSRQMEIWALWRGRQVLLLRTADQLRFGKIYRALQRVLEMPAPRR